MFRSRFAIALWLATAFAAGCSGSSSNPAPTPACHPDGTACAVGGDCCNEQCNGVICVAPGTVCEHIGDTGCTVFDPANPRTTDCCDGTCSGTGASATCKTISQCALLNEPCTGDGDCCGSSVCNGSNVCAEPPPPPCAGVGGGCTADSECCFGHCDPSTSQCAKVIECNLEGYACAKDTDCCSLSCPGAGMPGATCASTCRPAGSGTESLCSAGTQCCSGICDGTQHCAPVPAGTSSCKTLGEYCSLAGDCCSKNCVAGTSGSTCQPAYSACNAEGDICYGPKDCCTFLCSVPDGSTTPGRCIAPTGSGCTEDGLPCGGNSNCCTRKCVDLGSGVPVCQPAGGCRMTGDFCDSTQSCCGGTDPNQATSTTTMSPSPYGVYCDMTGKRDYSPYWDPSSKDNFVCSQGGSCNPPGNICGGSGADHVPASQNCCNSNPTGSGKDVCAADINGIMRCFGGGSATCPSGYHYYLAAPCCVPNDGVCSSQSECCDLALCQQDAYGVPRCNGAACKPKGEICSTAGAGGPAPTPDPCCSGTSCQWQAAPVSKWECKLTTTCIATGSTGCNTTPCCTGMCVSNSCVTCKTTGITCGSGAECCSGVCDIDAHVCVASCTASGGSCGATSECCQTPSPLICDFSGGGSTTGTCTGGSTCAATGTSCATALCCNATDSCTGTPVTCQPQCVATNATTCDGTHHCCNATDTCTGGRCTAPAACRGESQTCSAAGGANACCTDLNCLMPDPITGDLVTCASGATNCVCDKCAAIDQACTAAGGCCGAAYCATPQLSSCGTLDPDCLCRDVRL